MNELMHWASIAATAFAAAMLSGIVLHERIREGLVIKIGLVVCVLSLLALLAVQLGAGQAVSSTRADASLRVGLAVVCVGILLRARLLSRLRRERSKDESSTQQVRSAIYKITEPVRDLADMFGSDWAELDALNSRRERMKLAERAHAHSLKTVDFGDSRSWETSKWHTRPGVDR